VKNQVRGIALILFGILLCLSELFDGGPWIPIIDTPPYNLLGIISGIIGVILVFVGSNKSE
jgi:hypothetical protein